MTRRALTAATVALFALIPVATAAGQSCTAGLNLNFCGSTEVSASSSAISGRTVLVVTALSATAFAVIRASQSGKWKAASQQPEIPEANTVRFWRTPGSNGGPTNNPPDPPQSKGTQPNNSGNSNGNGKTKDSGKTTGSDEAKGGGNGSPNSDDHPVAGNDSNQGVNSNQQQGSDGGGNVNEGHDSQSGGGVEDGHDSQGGGDVEDGHHSDEDNQGDDGYADGCHLESPDGFVSALSHINGKPPKIHHGDDGDCSLPVTATPEPASMVLLGTGMLGFAGAYRWRRRRSD